MNRDELFKAGPWPPGSFDFGPETVAVFDDMVARSVPFYAEVQRLLTELSADFAVADSRLYDFGCSTGTTLLLLDRELDPGVAFVGVDASEDMLGQARRKLAAAGCRRPLDWLCLDLERTVPVTNASVVVMNLTLQFVTPARRASLLREIAGGLRSGGALLLVEKVLAEDPALDRLFVRHHHDFKIRQGYSELEIARKRDALENVLIPQTVDANRALLLSQGFRSAEVFFRWYNFCGMLALR